MPILHVRDPRELGPATYPPAVGFGTAVVVTVGLVIGLPLVVVGLAALGPVGWIAAAVVLPLATLATLLWVGRPRPGDPGNDG